MAGQILNKRQLTNRLKNAIEIGLDEGKEIYIEIGDYKYSFTLQESEDQPEDMFEFCEW